MPGLKRVCLDLSPNETMDRHGGFGRYGFYLFEHMARLPPQELQGIELFVLPRSDRPPMPARQALDRGVLEDPYISDGRHWVQRKVLTGSMLRARGIDLFHSTRVTALPLLQGCPVLATAHDLIPLVFPRREGGARNRLINAALKKEHEVRYGRPDHLIAISAATKEDLVRVFGLPPERITVIHHAVDKDLFRPEPGEGEAAALARKYQLPKRYFLCVGSDHYRKNQPLVFDAWSRVSSRVEEGLVLVGRSLYGDTFQQITASAKEQGVERRVRWLDSIEDHELPAFYRAATAFLAPSLYEGFGMTLLEAMACGTPVAAARASSYPEVGGDAALYFDPRSRDEVQDALLRIAQDPEVQDDMRRRGLERAAHFSWDAAARATVALYRRLA